MTRHWTLRALLLALAPLTALGCGGGSTQYNVSGKVTFKGQPVPAGWVNFLPDGSKGNDGATGRAPIHDGAYDTAGANGQGMVGGPMIVRIQGFDGQKAGDNALGKPIFNTFEVKMDLPKEKTTKDLEVPASWANQPMAAPPP